MLGFSKTACSILSILPWYSSTTSNAWSTTASGEVRSARIRSRAWESIPRSIKDSKSNDGSAVVRSPVSRWRNRSVMGAVKFSVLSATQPHARQSSNLRMQWILRGCSPLWIEMTVPSLNRNRQSG